jgi:hypothetical protein
LINGSASASDGGPVNWVGQSWSWTGQVISGTPVIIQYGVKVLAATTGAEIVNKAYLDDGAGQQYELTAQSVYDPLFRLTINNGALYTNVPTVTLSLSWGATTPPITSMSLSNDGGFGPGSQTMPVAEQVSWGLSTYGSHILPRFVFAIFFDSLGGQYGPLQDEIIYDPNPPELEAEMVRQPGASQLAGQGSQTFIRVTSRDDNSGVEWVVISSQPDFAPGATVSYPVSSAVQEWPWPGTGPAYVKVTDRAGNVSAVKQADPPAEGSETYLPVIVKPGAGG